MSARGHTQLHGADRASKNDTVGRKNHQTCTYRHRKYPVPNTHSSDCNSTLSISILGLYRGGGIRRGTSSTGYKFTGGKFWPPPGILKLQTHCYFSTAADDPCYFLVGSAWLLLFPDGLWMLAVICWWALEWLLLFPGGLCMVPIVSWWAVDGSCYFIFCHFMGVTCMTCASASILGAKWLQTISNCLQGHPQQFPTWTSVSQICPSCSQQSKNEDLQCKSYK